MIKQLFFLSIFCLQFSIAQQSPHGAIKIPCEVCHSTDSWKFRKDASFDHDSTGFTLQGQHRVVQCSNCHRNLVFSKQSSECTFCHTDVHRSELGGDCLRCHTMNSWIISDMKDKHQQTRFPLLGKHAVADCSACHERASTYRFAGTPLTCIACHRTDYEATSNPNHIKVKFSVDCSRCHKITATAWSGSFDHNNTKFSLTGAHVPLQCQSCHTNGNYQLAYSSCYQCHQTNYQNTINPNHVIGNFGQNCQTCHTTTAWGPASFDHAVTKFPLTGAHIPLQCQSCHTNGNYQLVYSSCYQCHQANYQNATDPNHVAGNFSHNCSQCHTTSSWSGGTFNHNNTKFSLTGAHVPLQCQSCHTNGNYQLAYSSCYQCHQTNYQNIANPNHVSGNFGQNCQTCHSTTAWTPATFDHAVTKFQLTGSHIALQCVSCHLNGNYQVVYTDCYQCHQTNYQQPINPNHVTANLSHDCTPCHTTIAWTPATFDHSTTKFQLTGTHTTTLCQSCHTNGNYQLAYTDCYQCHQTNYQLPTNPNHVTANLGHDCTPCHTTTAWTPATFDHNNTKFSLTGAHVQLLCQSCHTNGNYQLAYSSCYQCHQTNYQNTTNPNHVSGNFGQNCQTCHTTIAWSPASFSHVVTKFPLTGSHIAVPCVTCHTGGNYQLAYTDCYQCHQTNYQNATNPNHVTGNYIHDCTQCHSTTAWSPATFNHGATQFPLTGVHTTVPCQSCHSNGNYQLEYTDCYPCHTTQYQQVTNPNHITQLFPHDCAQCHSTSVWTPNTMNHDVNYFKIYSGTHRGRWTQCNQCHTTAGSLAAFSCTTGCHQTAHHQGENCYSCHRNN